VLQAELILVRFCSRHASMANTSSGLAFTCALQNRITSGWHAARSWDVPDEIEGPDTGGGCGGNCAIAAGPAARASVIVKTAVRIMHPPWGIRPATAI
jgi:hypothetical protein